MQKVTKLACIGSQCVACGCCVSACPKGAIHIDSGVIAKVDAALCIGCGKCARLCPAAVIALAERRVTV